MDITKVLASDLFAGQTVFVTGGGSGINLGIAKSFARLGANIGLCGRTQSKLDNAAAELEALGATVCAVAADVRDEDSLAESMAAARDALGPVSTLVAGAAGNFMAPPEKLSLNGFKTVVDIDLVGSFNAASVAFEQLRETRGSIIFISAGQALMPFAQQAHAGAAKAGVDNLMRSLALEWGPYGIRANSICPGPIEGTEGIRRLAPPGSEDKISALVPLRRMGKPEDIGATACYLTSPLADYVTGTVVMADGGMAQIGSGLWTRTLAQIAEKK